MNDHKYMSIDGTGIQQSRKIPDYVNSHLLSEFWTKLESEWWYLTEVPTTIGEVSVWIAARDWSDEAHILLPGSAFWLTADSHSLAFTLRYEPDIRSATMTVYWPMDIWLLENEEGVVHITHYLVYREKEDIPNEE